MIYQHLLEQRAKVTKAQKAKFARDINRLIKNTGKLERAKVEAMVKLLQRSRNDLSDIIVGLPKGPFRADMAELLKSQVQELLTDFQNKAIPELAVAQEEFAVVGQEFTDELIRSQARRPPIIAIKPEIIENAATRSADLIRSLSTRQVRRASDLINRSVITGDSVGELAQKMRKEFSKGIAQMETIVRTEVLGIHSQVQMAELQAMVIDTPGLHKQWITVRDGRQRPDHDAAHLQSVPVDVPFRIGRDLLQFPRDPAAPAKQVIQCRCTMVPDFSAVEETPDAPTAAALETKDLAPPEIKLGDLARRVAADVKESFAIQR